MKRNKYTAAGLAILLGGFGIHKFYLGKWIQGLVYLLFAWTFIPAVIGFIEGFIYLSTLQCIFDKKYNKSQYKNRYNDEKEETFIEGLGFRSKEDGENFILGLIVIIIGTGIYLYLK